MNTNTVLPLIKYSSWLYSTLIIIAVFEYVFFLQVFKYLKKNLCRLLISICFIDNIRNFRFCTSWKTDIINIMLILHETTEGREAY